MADVLTYDSEYLAEKRNDMKNDVAGARYRVGNNWYQAKIENAVVRSNGQVEVTFTIDHTVSGNITVTEIELCDRHGKRIAGRKVSITRQDATEGILYVCRLSLFQVVPNTSGTGAYDAL